MIKIIKAVSSDISNLLSEMKSRSEDVQVEVNKVAADIMDDVRLRGFDAVSEYSMKFDKALPRELSSDDLKKAAENCPRDLYNAMKKSAENIYDYQSRLLAKSSEWEVYNGSRLGQIVRGLERVGVYVPGGRAAYPSSVLMNAIPAKVAGVCEIVMVTPPTENLNNAVMAAAEIAGVDRVIAVGGVQAVAAMTYGAGFIPKVDKLVGPGNAFVAAAKRIAFGSLDIDMIAGPSEILIISDGSVNPKIAAADMLSQAEHDVLASAILITTSQEFAESVAAELKRQCDMLERKAIIEQALRDYGAILVCETLEDACSIANDLAPEHLELLTEKPRDLLPLIKNAGAVFLGGNSPEPLGDYMAGPSHVLPTSGTARFFSPLSVDSFLKKMSVIEYSEKDLKAVRDEIEVFAKSEGLTAHANSIKVRFE